MGNTNTNKSALTWTRPEMLIGDAHATLGIICETLANEGAALTNANVSRVALQNAATLAKLSPKWAKAYRTVAAAL